MRHILLTALLTAAGCHTFYDPDSAPLGPDAGADAQITGDSAQEIDCEGEPDWALCVDQAAQCGTISVEDRCGSFRTIECGACPPNAECGAEQPNVCACACPAAVGCLAVGAPHPDGSCRVCAATGWEVVADAACSDGDPCTVEDACQADGTCAGVARDCTPDDCATGGACDPDTGLCVYVPVADGQACGDDGLDCTDDVCEAGRCAHRRAPLTCVIDGMCVAQDGLDECLVCDVQTNPFAWTRAPDGTTCLAGAGSCSAGECL